MPGLQSFIALAHSLGDDLEEFSFSDRDEYIVKRRYFLANDRNAAVQLPRILRRFGISCICDHWTRRGEEPHKINDFASSHLTKNQPC